MVARRVRLDVRWDPGTLDVAGRVATRDGLKVAVVMRQAVEIGLSTLVNGGEGAGVRAFVTRTGEELVVSGRPSGAAVTVPAAGSDSSRSPAGVSAPRPEAPAAPAVRLEVVAARLLADPGGQGVISRSLPPADLVRARKLVLAGGVLVAGGQCRNPAQLVAPVDVSLG